MQMALGIIIGILVILGIYAVSMLFYFHFRKKYAETKYVVEVAFIAIALVVSIAVKAVLIFVGSSNTVTTGFSGILHAIYSGFGGLTLEGLSDLSEIENVILQCCYTGSSLYAALMFVSVITAKANYEVYSGLLLVSIRFRLFCNKRYSANTDLYLFTSVTEDSLILAKSIEERYTTGASKDRECVIMFVGDELDAFDRKDSLHRIIMSRGYIFWPYFKSKNKDKNISILKRLGLFIDNGFFGTECDKIDKDTELFRIEAIGEYLTKVISYSKRINSETALSFIETLIENWQKKYKAKFPSFRSATPDGKMAELREFCLKNKLRKKYFITTPTVTEKNYNNESEYILMKQCKAPLGRVHIFALGNNEELSGLECANSDIVFDEVSCLTQEMVASKRKKTIVDFYILTDNEINYEYYEREVEIRIREGLKGKGVNDDEIAKLLPNLAKYFQLHVINEATISGKCLAQARIEEYLQNDVEGEESIIVSDSIPNKDNTFRALVLGFGKTGQHAMNTIFIDTAYVDKDGVPSEFIADVYDSAMGEKAGIFAMTHPMFICDGKGEERIKQAFTQKTIDKLSVEGQIKTFEEVKKYMQLPKVYFHNESCFDLSFLEFLDSNIGIETVDEQKPVYNAFILALGNDERNIAMGNALIDDLKHEYSYINKPASVFPQTLYINIRDEKNYDRINWTEEDKKIFPKLKIVKFGNREKMYSYEQIIDDENDAIYNCCYESVTDKEGAEAFDIVKEAILQPQLNAEKDYIDYIKTIRKKLDSVDTMRAREKWLAVPMFKKESNSAANRFRIYFEKRLNGIKRMTGTEVLYYAQIEHNRWNRFHIANGWMFADYDKTGEDPNFVRKKEKRIREKRKEHDCICPFNMINVYTTTYDIVNFTMAYKDAE